MIWVSHSPIARLTNEAYFDGHAQKKTSLEALAAQGALMERARSSSFWRMFLIRAEAIGRL